VQNRVENINSLSSDYVLWTKPDPYVHMVVGQPGGPPDEKQKYPTSCSILISCDATVYLLYFIKHFFEEHILIYLRALH